MARRDDGDRLPATISAETLAQLRALLGSEAVLIDPARVLPYQTDAMPLHRGDTSLVLLPGTPEEAAEVVRILHRARLPWVPRGTGTGLSGGALALGGAAVVSLARLRRTVAIDAPAARARAQAGVINLQLNEELSRYRLQFAPDPGSQMAATIGGNLAENAGGPHTLKYGVTAQHVLGVTLILGDGALLQLGGEEETPGGYDLLGLLIGSEGTFGIVSEATLRLTPLPEAVGTFLAVMPSVDAAGQAVGELLRAGVVPAALEMIDATVLGIFAELSAYDFSPDAAAVLIGEVDGLDESVSADVETCHRVLAACGARQVDFAQSEAERARLWDARKQTFGALGKVAPNYITHDSVIPRSALPTVLGQIAEVGKRMELRIANVFHAGDGNLHPTILCDAADHALAARAAEAGDEILRICLRAGGVLTGEHGIGVTKREAMRLVATEDEIHLLHRLRQAFDPWNLVNPGKVLPPLVADIEEDSFDVDGVGRARVHQAGRLEAPARTPVAASGDAPLAARPERQMRASEARLVECLQRAAQEKIRLAPRGGGTLMVTELTDDGAGEGSFPRVLETWGSDRILHHHPGDFTITVEAGTTLASVNRALHAEGQQLAWEAPDPEMATLGGLVSAGFWASYCQQRAHPKHSLLGFRAITGEGRLIEFGARVVKNVTGYDVGKLLVGSRGTLAIFTELTLRTYPLPEQTALAAASGSFLDLLDLAANLSVLALGWTMIDLLAGPEGTTLLVGLDGRSPEVNRRWRELQNAAGANVQLCMLGEQEAHRARRAAADALNWSSAPLILRLVTSPGRIVDLAARVQGLCAAGEDGSWTHRILCHPGIGLMRVAFDPGYQEVALRRLLLDIAEAVRSGGGYRALDRAPGHPWWGWDVWGAPAALRDRMRRIRTIFDPRGTLQPWISTNGMGGD